MESICASAFRTRRRMVQAAKARMSFKWQIRSATCITRRRPSPCVLGSTQKGKNTPMVKGEGLLQRNIIYNFVWRCIHLLSFIFIYIKTKTKTLFFFSGFAGCEPASLVVLSFWKNSTWHFLQTFSSVNMGYGIGHLRLSEYIENYMAGKLRIIERTSFFWKENSWEFSWRWDMSHFKRLVVKEQIHSEVWKQTCEH